MLYLIDEARDRIALGAGETRELIARGAAEGRDRLADAGAGARLRAAELAELARDRTALVLGLLALAVAGGLLLAGARGGGEPGAASAADRALIGPTLVQRRGFSLSLPDDWVRADAPDGAVFAAQSPDGAARSTLWVERDPGLGFDRFVGRSLAGLAKLGDDARVTDRVDGPTVESSSAELRAAVALDGRPAGPYRVNLRAAGPYRYYLATSIRPGAGPELLADAELIGSSLRPEVKLRGAPR